MRERRRFSPAGYHHRRSQVVRNAARLLVYYFVGSFLLLGLAVSCDGHATPGDHTFFVMDSEAPLGPRR